MDALLLILPLIAGWILDMIFADPPRLPHPVVLFGRLISFGEKHLNRGTHRRFKGGLLAIILIALTFAATLGIEFLLSPWRWADGLFQTVMIFFCLAGTTLCREVKMVFVAADRSLDEGRKQVARIVGRDTSQLTGREVRIAALETLAENLSDGVVAPLFWYALLGVPGMVTYKMINTLDSMIGYRTERYARFGTVAARIDDIANYIPARITAFLMIIVAGRHGLLRFVFTQGPRHASPNSGWPEAALAGILGCRFGGPHSYFSEIIDKPFIGTEDRDVDMNDMHRALRVNRAVGVVSAVVAAAVRILIL